MSNVKEQHFEIVAIEHPNYIERMNALDHITTFETLEESFITDEYITVRMKSFDRLTELFSNTEKYKKMMKLWNEMNDFLGWIHFTISELRSNNNIEKTIRYILERRGYPFKDFWYRYYISKTKNQIFQKVVDVALSPITIYNEYNSEFMIETRWTQYGLQYHYEMVIKILVEKKNELFSEYIYIRTWSSQPDMNKKFYEKINYIGDQKK